MPATPPPDGAALAVPEAPVPHLALLLPLNGDSKGRREIVKYQADYIFWKAA